MTKRVRLFLVTVWVVSAVLPARAVDKVYWAGDRIRSLDINPTATSYSVAWSVPAGPVAIDNVNQRIYWGDNSSSPKIMWAPLSGGTPTVFLTNVVPQRIDDLEIDSVNQYIYWTDQTYLRIYRSSIGAPAVSQLPLTPATIGTLRDIALDTRPGNSKLYWLTSRDIYRADLNGTNHQKLLNPVPNPIAYGMAIDPCTNRIIITGRSLVQQVPPTEAGSIFAVDLADAGNAVALLEDPLNPPWSVHIDPRKIVLDVHAGKMYWAAAQDGSGPATINSANLDGTNPQVIAQATTTATWSNELALALANRTCPVIRKGLTWAQISINQPTGTVKVGCANSCNAHSGDTPCSTPLPMLCIRKSGTGFPLPKPLTVSNTDQNYRWSGGIIGTTAPLVPPATRAAANAVCVQQFGADWRVAEFHDGWGWGFQAFGGAGNALLRFWVDINDQPGALCWQ